MLDTGELTKERAGVKGPCWIGAFTNTFLILMLINKRLSNEGQNNLISFCFVPVSALVLGGFTWAQGASNRAVRSIMFCLVSFRT